MVADVVAVPSCIKRYIIEQFSDRDGIVKLFGGSKITEDGFLL